MIVADCELNSSDSDDATLAEIKRRHRRRKISSSSAALDFLSIGSTSTAVEIVSSNVVTEAEVGSPSQPVESTENSVDPGPDEDLVHNTEDNVDNRGNDAANDETAQLKKVLGIGGVVVMKLCENILRHQNCKLFADNFFTSLQLVKKLQNLEIQFTGKVRANRLKGCNSLNEKSLQAEGRDSFNQKVELDSTIVAVRWFDNKTEDLISS
ncbi:hypothetical protein RRG08_042492 [Elysia crispata]|uniref:PiggyBac transposable element-derived protein domain-containing protein n=1 Tax=Elysia crispata TaxID=231223 RepID=A0AAE1CWM3_9GAST|nr:hypothetical protein RRG08_042492 [Elysia crispata]